MADLFKAGSTVDHLDTDTGVRTTWTVVSHLGDKVKLTRSEVAPWASMDSIMGNGPAPQRLTYHRTLQVGEDGTIKTIEEDTDLN